MPTTVKLDIRRLGYSANPWRLVESGSGREITITRVVGTSTMAAQPIRQSVSGATKAACLAEALDVLGRYMVEAHARGEVRSGKADIELAMLIGGSV